ncbi:MAG TPA: ATP-dependent helicase [Thermoanaerobaculia bacterium]|nr:ATP-dependent helicase [Thermoanaerobaculia bacterium]
MVKIRKYTLKAPERTKAYRVRYEEELNPQQLEVVMAGDGPILVIAGAGSGKTRTLTYRVSRLIEDGVEPSEILLLTFTNKAAREMLDRVEQLATTDARRIQGGTFHSAANRILRQHADVLGYQRTFSILDEEDAKGLMDGAIADAGIPTLERRFPKGDVLLDVHSHVINMRGSLEKYVEENFPQFLVWLDEMRRVFGRYAERKRKASAMDFDDLLVNWKRLLEETPEVAEALKRRFRHVLVDEYQDTNRLQAEIVDAMASVRPNVMVVGDDAQSIYSFRGASFENILTFPRRFPGCRIYKLEMNYRSTPEILDLANASIRNNRYQFPKQLMPTRPSGPQPAMVGVDDVYAQAQFVAQRILELRDEGEPLDEIAVLYRSHYQSLEIQMELSRRNIPYLVRSGVRFFEQAHVKDVVSYLRILNNPKDELSWIRVMKLYPKVGDRTARAVWEAISSLPDPLHAFLGSGAGGGSRASAKSLASLRSTLRALTSEAMRRSPAEAIRLVVEQGYGDYVRTRFANFSARLDDLEQLALFAEKFESVDELLEELSLANPIAGEDVAAAGVDDEKVVLSSVHQAKGLEWRAVFVTGLSDGKFPSSRALRVPGGIVRVPGTEAKLPETEEETEALMQRPVEAGEPVSEIVIPGEEEERRLFYVAITRAKQELYLVYPVLERDRARMDVLLLPSRFIREIPEDRFEKWLIE